ncbi:outer membrane transport energization protein ExbD [Desulfocicer vacuolatum DSM 3385]|uniref:Outer membrane transport energization protein ExbD n=1 Tax=Desulfocicer vacuolatum DSM 3385 TaxID=1121400 RepID=A0A1W2DEV7_9BACT|nr:biopolymer transporter ExbD [Desulfocicer vacuolatum]SMC95682.1 outer membrane transport energization protein ExbD [Desulfocicer vacuolatum DSM 3385]
MLVHRKKRPRYEIQAPLTSLIDIVFMLLIYFMLTTNFMVDEGIKIKLPQARAAAPQKSQEITLYVDKEGRAWLNEKEVAHDRLFKMLKEKIAGGKDQLVIVKADRSVMLNKAVKVMDIAKAAGAARLCLATEKDF